MLDAVHEAGRGLLDEFGKVKDLRYPVGDARKVVADADAGAARTLRGVLLEADPAIGLLMEGSEEIEGQARAVRWVVDPLDGTANFERGLAHWAISVALEVEGEIVAGVVHDPVRQETFSACQGSGAFLNGEAPLRTSERGILGQGMLATGMPPGGSEHFPVALASFDKLLRASAGVRQWGAAALDLAYVAAGRLDGYWNRNLKPWHYAAGLLLIREAGGLVEPLEGGPEEVDNGDLVGISADLFPEFAATLRG
ncbi:MAG: inositol monophosphatase family protein [Pseudomonadota bacterium]